MDEVTRMEKVDCRIEDTTMRTKHQLLAVGERDECNI